MTNESTFNRALLVFALLLASLPALQAASRSTYSPTIKEVRTQKDGAVQITFTVLIETLYHCPGANGKVTDRGLELTFVRSSFKRTPKVDYPAQKTKKEGKLAWTITVPAQAGGIYLRDGKKLVKLQPTEKGK